MDKSFEIGIVRDAVDAYYDRLGVWVEITVEHRVMNHYEATVTHTDTRFGKVTAHHTLLLIDGRAVFQ